MQALHPTPSIPTVVQGSANSTTKSAVAPGTIDIRENPTQDISALSRDTANTLNELGRIFDKKSVEEQKELVNVFREEAFRLLHNLPDDGSGRKVLLHFIVGGLISQFAGAGFASGAAGAGLNEALIKALDGKDPGTAQIISAIIGAAAAKVAGGNALAGASAAASGTKWNKYERLPEIREQLYLLWESGKYETLRYGEYEVRYGEIDGKKVAVAIDNQGKVYDLEVTDNKDGISKFYLNGKLLTEYHSFNITEYQDYGAEQPKLKTEYKTQFTRGEYNGSIPEIKNLYGTEYLETQSLDEAKNIFEQKIYKEYLSSRTPLTDAMKKIYPASFFTPGAFVAKGIAVVGAGAFGILKETKKATAFLTYAHAGNGEPVHFQSGSLVSYDLSNSVAITNKLKALGAHFTPGETRDIYMAINLNTSPATLDEQYAFGWIKLAIQMHKDNDGSISFKGVAGDAYNYEFHKWGASGYSLKNLFTDTINNGAYMNQSLGYLQPFIWTSEIQGTIQVAGN